jgi:hypothetical protein
VLGSSTGSISRFFYLLAEVLGSSTGSISRCHDKHDDSETGNLMIINWCFIYTRRNASMLYACDAMCHVHDQCLHACDAMHVHHIHVMCYVVHACRVTCP